MYIHVVMTKPKSELTILVSHMFFFCRVILEISLNPETKQLSAHLKPSIQGLRRMCAGKVAARLEFLI